MSVAIRLRPWIFRITSLLAGFLFVLVLGEIAARLLWTEPRWPQPPARDLPVLRTVRELRTPNIEGIHKRVVYRTNSLGLRGPEWSGRAEPGVFRILVTGDSVTVGSGVDENARYSQRLETRLRPPDGIRYEVVNTALGGLNAEYAFRRLEKGTEAYAPNLLLYGFTPNDIEGSAYKAHESTPGAGRKRWLRMARYQGSPSYLLRTLWPRWVTLENDLFGDGFDKRQEILENYFENPAAWSEFQNSLDKLARYAKKRRLCAHVFVIAALDDLDSSHRYFPIYDLVMETARGLGLTASASFTAFDGMDERSLWVAPTDSHPNAQAHELLSEALYEGLRELPERCWNLPDGFARPIGLRDAPAASPEEP